MKNPSTFLVKVSKHKGKERFGTGPLKMEPRLLAYVIAWIITHRVRNHAQLTEEDLFLICLMPGDLKMNWVNVVAENLLKTKRIGSFMCPMQY